MLLNSKSVFNIIKDIYFYNLTHFRDQGNVKNFITFFGVWEAVKYCFEINWPLVHTYIKTQMRNPKGFAPMMKLSFSCNNPLVVICCPKNIPFFQRLDLNPRLRHPLNQVRENVRISQHLISREIDGVGLFSLHLPCGKIGQFSLFEIKIKYCTGPQVLQSPE